MSEVKKGSEIISKLEEYSYNNCQEELLQEIVEMLRDTRVVPEEKWLRIQKLMEDKPKTRKEKVEWIGNKGEAKSDTFTFPVSLLDWENWYDALRNVMEE